MTGSARNRLRAGQAAKYIQVSVSTLAKWRMRQEGPPFHRLGPRIVFYFQDEIDAWFSNSPSHMSGQSHR